MPLQEMAERFTKITGTGVYIPPNRLTNNDLVERLRKEYEVETSDAWIRERTGIKERRVSQLSNVEQGTIALQQALKAARMEPSDLDLIICATNTQEFLFPARGAKIQENIQKIIENNYNCIAAVDIQAGCSSGMFAEDIADSYIKSGKANTIAVIATDTLTRRTNYKERSTCILFGDGAAAEILTISQEPGFIAFDKGTDGRIADTIFCKTLPDKGQETPCLTMNGREVYEHAVKRMKESVKRVLELGEKTINDISLFIAHQANARINESVARKLEIPPDRCFSNIEKYGNVSCPSIFICRHEAYGTRKLKPGDITLSVVIGSGFTWLSSLYREI